MTRLTILHWVEVITLCTGHDAQSEAYRLATESDSWDGDLNNLEAIVHQPIDSVKAVKLPEIYEFDSWDFHRDAPKTVHEAKTLLRSRVSDPHAPDGEDERCAYENDL